MNTQLAFDRMLNLHAQCINCGASDTARFLRNLWLTNPELFVPALDLQNVILTSQTIRDHIANGAKISAIKELRAETNCRLRDAIAAVNYVIDRGLV